LKSALVTGITGQDGSYLAELLLEKGYRVFGLERRNAVLHYERIRHILKDLTLCPGDLTDLSSLIRVLDGVRPDEVYNLAAQSFVPLSWNQPTLTAEVNSVSVVKVLEAVRIVNPKIRFYQASSSEIFGQVRQVPQNEETPLNPVSPYGIAKAFSHFTTAAYRQRYGLFAVSGILFNHESPRRGLEFVTRKISWAAARIKVGAVDHLTLGNLEARRDWGYAKDYVEAMWLMLQHEQPEDFVIATGEDHSVRDFAEAAFAEAGLDYRAYVREDATLRRLNEVHHLLGDPRKAVRVLGWNPTKTPFRELVRVMVQADLERVRSGKEEATAEASKLFL